MERRKNRVELCNGHIPSTRLGCPCICLLYGMKRFSQYTHADTSKNTLVLLRDRRRRRVGWVVNSLEWVKNIEKTRNKRTNERRLSAAKVLRRRRRREKHG